MNNFSSAAKSPCFGFNGCKKKKDLNPRGYIFFASEKGSTLFKENS